MDEKRLNRWVGTLWHVDLIWILIFLKIMMNYSAQVAITQYHRLESLKTGEFISHSSKVPSQGLAGFCLRGGLSPGLYMATYLHMAFILSHVRLGV